MNQLERLNHLLNQTMESLHATTTARPEARESLEAKTLVLYGAGNIGRTLLRCLQADDRNVVAFADGNQSRQGQEIDGVPIMSPADAAKQFGSTATVIVCVTHSSPGAAYEPIEARLRDLGFKSVTPYHPYFHVYPDALFPTDRIEHPQHILDAKEQVLNAYELWSDDSSRKLYVDQIDYLLAPTHVYLLETCSIELQYVPPRIVTLTDRETIIDCGAFDGDSAKTFVEKTRGKFKLIQCFEPDPINFAKLKGWRDGLSEDVREHIKVDQLAVGDSHGTLNLDPSGSMMTSVLGAGSFEVECVRLDDYLDCTPTYMKFDIEGAEPLAVEGAVKTITSAQPKIAMCVYHRQDHMWTLPLRLKELLPNHTFHLVHHGTAFNEYVCYAIPKF